MSFPRCKAGLLFKKYDLMMVINDNCAVIELWWGKLLKDMQMNEMRRNDDAIKNERRYQKNL